MPLKWTRGNFLKDKAEADKLRSLFRALDVQWNFNNSFNEVFLKLIQGFSI